MIRSAALLMLLAVCVGTPTTVQAQGLDNNQGAIEITEPDASINAPRGAPKGFQPKVGRKAAEKYMAPRQPTAGDESAVATLRPSAFSSDAHYLALHIGTYVSDNSYKWGGVTPAEDVGKLNIGLTYRLGEWVNSADMAIRVDFSTYQLQEGKASKLSLLPIVLFPDAKSKFPLYFGGGIGAGVFVNQVSQESPLSIDYQLLAGARFFDVIESMGFFIEAGIKNHLFLLSDGQYNGTFVALGTVFSF